MLVPALGLALSSERSGDGPMRGEWDAPFLDLFFLFCMTMPGVTERWALSAGRAPRSLCKDMRCQFLLGSASLVYCFLIIV